MKKTYKLSDKAIARIAQALTECIAFQTDITDILRKMDLEDGQDGLEPTAEYTQSVKNDYEKRFGLLTPGAS